MVRSILFVFSVVLAGPGSPGVDPVAETIRRRIEVAGQPAEIRIGDELVHASQALPNFYERRGFAPVWSTDGKREPRAQRLLAAIRGVEAQGLRASNYHLEALASRLSAAATDVGQSAETDLLLTDAFLVLAAHLVSGRVDPATFEPEWIATRREVDPVGLLERVVSGEPLDRVLQGLQPKHAGYGRMTGALARYRAIEAAGGWPSMASGAALKPGAGHAEIEWVRTRLAATGDLGADPAADLQLYDEELVQAVIRFQRRHGLDDDGVIGSKTREALNVSVAQRIRSIQLNLERWRWLPQELGERHVLVNVPGFRLQVSEAGEEVLAMRVIVGRALRRTPVFSDVIRYLVFSPSWEVPPTILRQDKLPEIRKNPGYVAEQNMRVFLQSQGNWVEVEPQSVDWANATTKTVRLRQRPGPNNALGRVKFMFPNSFSVYLHDTPSRELFARSQRDFSSGCVRIERPAELAAYLLGEDPTWSRAAILQAMESGQERSVTLPRPIPVHILYWTAWAEADGSVQFRSDIYGRDPRLDRALRLPPPVEP